MKAHFTRTKTAAAVSALLAALALSPAQAVNIANDGLGEVGLASYYTVRAGYTTNLSIVNTSSTYVVAVKLRFRRAADSADVRDFNIFLSPNDVWAGTVGLGAATGLAYVQTTDTSCTAPAPFPASTPNTAANRQQGFVVINSTSGLKQMDFDNRFGATTHEGYFEVIEMGVALPVSKLNPKASEMASWAVHGTTQDCNSLANVYPPVNNVIQVTGSHANPDSGLTLNCEIGVVNPRTGAQVVPGDLISGNDAFHAEFCEPLNVIKVAANLTRVNTGVAMPAGVTTVANFVNPASGIEDKASPNPYDITADPAGPFPDLASGTYGPIADIAAVQVAPNGALVNATFPEGDSVNAVSSLLMANSVINEFQWKAAPPPATTWVVTFPTKHYYNGDSPFFGDCATIGLRYYNREEKTTTALVPPSPIVPGQTSALCSEAQTVSFGTGVNLFQSSFNSSFPIKTGFPAGWARLNLPADTGINSIISNNGYTFTGLPVIGFGLTSVANGAVGVAAVNAGQMRPHAYERMIDVPAATGR